MPRTMSAQNITDSQAEVVRPILLADLFFSDATIHVTNAPINISFGGNTYFGVGAFGSISQIEETGTLQNTNLELTLTGVDPTYISEALSTNYKGNDATVYMALLDSGHQVSGDPFIIFDGVMDSMPITINKESTVTLIIESKLAAWEIPKVRRYNNQDQQDIYPSDTGLEYVEQMKDKRITWGK
jgi:hypothetical protein